MRVNSASTGFLIGYWVRSCMAMGMLAIFLFASAFSPKSDLREKELNLIIRQIGHRLLLQAGDSSSRVLPVTEISNGTFQLRFEKEFAFSHDSLMLMSRALLPKIQFPSGYTVTVHDCAKADIVYGFHVSYTSPDILGCRGRREPAGCYIIEFTFPDYHEEIEEEAVKDHSTAESKPEKVVLQKSRREESAVVPVLRGTSHLAEDLKGVKAVPKAATPQFEGFKAATFDSLTTLLYGGMLILLGTLLIGRFGKILVPARVQSQGTPIAKEYTPELPGLGRFSFDVKGQRLLFGNEVVSLTEKECKVLELLHQNFGELIPRETLMQKVWIDEGVITGRSLDMFISKLRKKLSRDAELRITNVHGKGYRLETSGNS